MGGGGGGGGGEWGRWDLDANHGKNYYLKYKMVCDKLCVFIKLMISKLINQQIR